MEVQGFSEVGLLPSLLVVEKVLVALEWVVVSAEV